MEQQQFIKEEIYTHDGFAWGMSIKQEMKDEIFTSTFQNLIDESMHPIKQEIDDDLNTNKAMEEYTIKVEKDKSNSHIVNIQNIGNKFKYLKVKYGIRPKSKELLEIIKHVNSNTIAGIIICKFCGNVYTKQKEYLCHFSTNHFMRFKKIMYKTKFCPKNSYTRGEVTDFTIIRNQNVKNEMEIVEHDLKTELQDNRTIGKWKTCKFKYYCGNYCM
ncbi:uncharacterized protein LOC130447997 isoform X5 [Diorhabda sublineata]|uniref:uncharacterized protein LOC130447997 isoform X5 n=1 Tax=Diorhabda sublineata TaxID=1163346 RepID=UPI0024E0486C|nr:uncharacterized protein LOC130447997 isoform X5 [Diorhabda sublineata]